LGRPAHGKTLPALLVASASWLAQNAMNGLFPAAYHPKHGPPSSWRRCASATAWRSGGGRVVTHSAWDRTLEIAAEVGWRFQSLLTLVLPASSAQLPIRLAAAGRQLHSHRLLGASRPPAKRHLSPTQDLKGMARPHRANAL
jgi:hypothetical protein